MLVKGIRGLIFIDTGVVRIIIEIIIGVTEVTEVTGLITRDATFPLMSVEDIACGGTGAGRENIGRRKENVKES